MTGIKPYPPVPYCIGFDPGLSGAIAVVRDCKEYGPYEVKALYDMPKNAGHIDAKRIAHIVRGWADQPPLVEGLERLIAAVEIQAPGATVASKIAVATYWEQIGIIEGILVSHKLLCIQPAPRTWRLDLGAGGGQKDRKLSKQWSVAKARELFPDADLGKRSDRAEALLIAVHGLRRYVNTRYL